MYIYTAHTLCEFALATLYLTLPNELHSLSVEMRLKSLNEIRYICCFYMCMLFRGTDNNTVHA